MKRKLKIQLEIPVTVKAPIEVDINYKDVIDWISECESRGMLTAIHELSAAQLKEAGRP